MPMYKTLFSSSITTLLAALLCVAIIRSYGQQNVAAFTVAISAFALAFLTIGVRIALVYFLTLLDEIQNDLVTKNTTSNLQDLEQTKAYNKGACDVINAVMDHLNKLI